MASLLALFTIPIGFYADDSILEAYLEQRLAPNPPWYDLYRFVPGDGSTRALIASGGLPWWSSPGLRVHLLRPLASALFALDQTIFGHAAVGFHLHSIAWYIALLAAVRLLYQRLLPGPTGTLALLVFALSNAAWNSVAWISARHVLVAALWVALALIAHLRASMDAWRIGRWLAPLAIAVGFLASEAAVGAVAYILAYAVAGPPSQRASRLREIAPGLAVFVVYLVVYVSVRGGAADSGWYVDPFAAPTAFAQALALRIPVLILDAVLRAPAELAAFEPLAPLVAAGIVAATLVVLLARKLRASIPEGEVATLRWLVLGGALALVPAGAAGPGSRMLLIPGMGFAALLATLIRHAFGNLGAGFATRRSVRAAAAILLIVHVVFAPVIFLGSSRALAQQARETERVARTVRIPRQGTRVVLVAASDPLVFLYAPAIIASEGRLAAPWSLLSAAHASHRLTRTAADTIELETIGTTSMQAQLELLYRAPRIPFRLGAVVAQSGAIIRVTAMANGRPTRIQIQFDAALEDPNRILLIWNGQRLERLLPPAVGRSVEIPWRPGPSGVF